MVLISEKTMLIKVDQFHDGVEERLEASYEPKDWDLDYVDMHYVKNIELSGVGERVKQTLTLRGTLTSRIEQTCNRCLSGIVNDISDPFDLTYEIRGEEAIDATNDLREILILRHPDHFLCSENCRGICAHCGANLNQQTCNCKQQWESQSGWTPLKEGFRGKDK
jgi:uncharacterized protein